MADLRHQPVAVARARSLVVDEMEMMPVFAVEIVASIGVVVVAAFAVVAAGVDIAAAEVVDADIVVVVCSGLLLHSVSVFGSAVRVVLASMPAAASTPQLAHSSSLPNVCRALGRHVQIWWSAVRMV